MMRWPFSRSRLISISLRPPSRPAACSGLGCPRTTTVVLIEGMPWTMAPACFAALRTSRRRLQRMPVNARCAPFNVRSAPALSVAGGLRQRLDQLVGALVALAPLADAAIDDLLQMIGAGSLRTSGARTRALRVALDQHAQQLPDLIHIVSRLPLRRGAGEDVAGRHQRIQRARGDAALIVLLADDAEVAELEARVVADEDVERREVAMQQLAAMQLAEHLQDAGDLAPRDRLRPPAAGGARNALRSPWRAYSRARQ